MANPNQVTVETLERLLDCFNAHDLDAIMEFFWRGLHSGHAART